MSMIIVGLIVILVLILIIMIVAIGIFVYLKDKFKKVTNTVFEFKDFFEGISAQKDELQAEPKTPYGMDSLIMPDLQKDFPYMHIDEMKSLAEESIVNYFKTGSQNPKEKIEIENIDIHKTVINKYTKSGSICTLIFQTSIGYDFIKNGSSKRVEDRINTEFIYIFDDKNLKANESISLHCPSCGAPIKGLGHKVCPYCNSGLIDIAPKTWKLNNIERLKP
ncbi:MAG: hypothetical protein IKR04_04400 [Clostridia bacterium]|nr:hypothetical protein [Clostridia bacterium]